MHYFIIIINNFFFHALTKNKKQKHHLLYLIKNDYLKNKLYTYIFTTIKKQDNLKKIKTKQKTYTKMIFFFHS